MLCTSVVKIVLGDCDVISEARTIFLVKSLATTVRGHLGPTFPCLWGEFAGELESFLLNCGASS